MDRYVGSTNWAPPEPGAPGPRMPYPGVAVVMIAATVAMTPDVAVPLHRDEPHG
jgi:hypothetical protein